MGRRHRRYSPEVQKPKRFRLRFADDGTRSLRDRRELQRGGADVTCVVSGGAVRQPARSR